MAPPASAFMSWLRAVRPVQPRPVTGRLGQPNQREAFGDAVVGRIAEFAPDLPRRSSIAGSNTPSTSSRTTGLTEGNASWSRLSLEQLFFSRPVPAGPASRPRSATSGCPAHRHRARRIKAPTSGSPPSRSCTRLEGLGAGGRGQKPTGTRSSSGGAQQPRHRRLYREGQDAHVVVESDRVEGAADTIPLARRSDAFVAHTVGRASLDPGGSRSGDAGTRCPHRTCGCSLR